MKKRRKRERRRKIEPKIIVLLFIIIFFAIIVVYQVTREPPPDEPKYSSEEYFEILEPIPGGPLSEDGSEMFLYYLTFKIKAVRGDAHEVYANSGGLGGQEPMWVGTILKGENKTVYLSFESGPINLVLDEDKFSVKLHITCVEARGSVTIDFPPPTT